MPTYNCGKHPCEELELQYNIVDKLIDKIMKLEERIAKTCKSESSDHDHFYITD